MASPAAPVLLLDADNRAAGWVPLSEAIASGRAYAVEPAPHLLALDADAVDSRYLALTQALADADAPTVELTSGGGSNRRHLWLSLSDAVPSELRAELEAVARLLGCDVRRRIRPPLSPHRSGTVGVLLTPGTPEQAAARLEARGCSPEHLAAVLASLGARGVRAQSTAHRPASLVAPSSAPLPPELEHLLATGDTGTYRSTSEALWTLELALANRGYSTAEALSLLLASPLWEASSKAGRPTGEAWLATDYSRALAHIAAHPRLASRPDAQELLSRLEAAALRWQWRPGLGARPTSLAKALVGVVSIGLKAGQLDGLGVSSRSLSLAASLSKSACVRALDALTAEGVLTRQAAPSRELAPRYGLNLGHPLWQAADAATAGDAAQPDADAWRYRGALGAAAWRHLALLELDGPMTAQELSDAYGCRAAHTRKVLARLASARLVRPCGTGWQAVPREERRRILAELDTGGVAVWHATYELQRRGWQERLAERERVAVEALAARLAASEAAGAAEAARWAAEVEARTRAEQEDRAMAVAA